MIPSVAHLAAWGLGQIARRGPTVAPSPGVKGWLIDSRNGVLLVLAAAFVLGGGRKLLQAMKARTMLDGLNRPEPAPESFVEATRHGRAAVMDLFRILGSSAPATTRDAAGYALSVLWKADELIGEEEKAIVSRGFVASWKARRRYPRAITAPIPIVVTFGVPFLQGHGDGVRPDDLEWSHRILGTDRVSLESFSPWQAGPALASFLIDPRDFPDDGPHKLVLHARVRTTSATSAWGAEDVGRAKKGTTTSLATSWELDLPQIPFSFEFDPLLTIDSLFTLPDATREAAFLSRIGLTDEPPAGEPNFAPLNGEWALRDLPRLSIQTPIPCDLAHSVRLEIEGCSQTLAAGSAVVDSGESRAITRPLIPEPNLPPEAIESIGERRIRAILTPDAQLGWANPEIRSIWPGTLATDWRPVRIVRI